LNFSHFWEMRVHILYIGYIICPAISSHDFLVRQNVGMDIEDMHMKRILIFSKFWENDRLLNLHILYTVKVHQLMAFMCMNSWILNIQNSLVIKLFPLTWLNFQKYFVHRTLSFSAYLLSQCLLGPFIHMTQRKHVIIIWWPVHVLSRIRYGTGHDVGKSPSEIFTGVLWTLVINRSPNESLQRYTLTWH
jgi:hypothetical protein